MASSKAGFHSWVSNAFEAYFEERDKRFVLGFEDFHRERLEESIQQVAVAKKQKIQNGYHPRSDGSTPNLQSFLFLKDLLVNAPGTDGEDFSYDNEAPEGLSVEHDGFSNTYIVSWTPSSVGN